MQQKIIKGKSADEIWQQVTADLNSDSGPLQYSVLLDHEEQEQVALIIDIDPGGGFESGYATTQFIAPLDSPFTQLKIYQQGLMQEAGKLFGLKDIETGIHEVDQKFIIQADNTANMSKLLANDAVRNVLLSFDELAIHATTKEDNEGREQAYLELTIEDGITNSGRLRQLYDAVIVMKNLISHTTV